MASSKVFSQWHQSTPRDFEDPVMSARTPRDAHSDPQTQPGLTIARPPHCSRHDFLPEQDSVVQAPLDKRKNLDQEPSVQSSRGTRASNPLLEHTSPSFLRTTDTSKSTSSSHITRDKRQFRSQPLSKRQKMSEPRVSYPRKRAVTACQVCRVRKSKCDNQRPVCGSCAQLDVECNYQDPKSDHSTFDPASLAILDRLNYSIQLMESQAQTLAGAEYLMSMEMQPHPSMESTTDAGIVFSAPLDPRSSFQGSIDESPHYVELKDENAMTLGEGFDLAANTSSGPVLEWPIFEGKFAPNDITALFYSADTSPQSRQDPRSFDQIKTPDSSDYSYNHGRGIQQEDIAKLIPEFLDNVHSKNPILDPLSLKAISRQMSENGFGWDGNSCLILIACALANLSVPFTVVRPGKEDISYLDARDYPTAEAYYYAARKRIGLLGVSVLATQCFFLVGVYEMYSLRPLQAWLSFSRACTTFQTYLPTQSHQPAQSLLSNRMEQRLYWSCIKSECEMRDEINLAPTGLARANYPDQLPSPPDGTPAREGLNLTATTSFESTFQRSWYYYLSEIALRRIANRIVYNLHRNKGHSWLEIPFRRLQRIAHELDAQVLQWADNIPGILAFDEDQIQTDELTHMLQARYFELRERIWRPFLYLAIHQEFAVADQSTITTYAQRCLKYVFNYINLGSVKHRHHGSWYTARQLFTCSLLLLAAVKSGKIAVSAQWRESIDLAMTCIKYWESEAPDLQTARLTLVSIFGELERRSD